MLIPQRVKRLLLSAYSNMGGVKIHNSGKNNKIIQGEHCILLGAKVIFAGNNNTLIIGNNCRLPKSTLYLIDDNNTIIIGDNNEWGENVNIIPEEGTTIKIGSDCQFAVNVVVRSSDGHSIISDETQQRINKARDISIGDRCWLGENVKILKGADIASDCIIGASTVVTKGNYETHSIYAGNPVRQVKKNVHWIVPRI